MDRIPRRAKCARAVAKFGRHDARARAAGPPLEPGEILIERTKQGWTGFGNAAADHHHFGIKHVDE